MSYNISSMIKISPEKIQNLKNGLNISYYSMITQFLLFLSNFFVIVFLYIPITDYTMKRGLSVTIISLLTISIIMLIGMFVVNYKHKTDYKIPIIQFFLNFIMLIMFSCIHESQTKSNIKTNLKRQKYYYKTTYVFALISIISNTVGLYISLHDRKLCDINQKTSTSSDVDVSA